MELENFRSAKCTYLLFIFQLEQFEYNCHTFFSAYGKTIQTSLVEIEQEKKKKWELFSSIYQLLLFRERERRKAEKEKSKFKHLAYRREDKKIERDLRGRENF